MPPAIDDEEITVQEDADLQNFLPGGFGKATESANVEAQIERARRPRPQPTKKAKPEDSDDDDDDDDGDDGDDDPEDDYPISHDLPLKTHERPVTTLDLDASGARLATGSSDCTFKLHDFASMAPNMRRAFKSVDPTAAKPGAAAGTGETHPVHHVEFHPLAPAQLLVVAATPQARVFSRDGALLTEFVKGDMYLRDMHNTKGHVSEVTTGTWHPDKRDVCVTAGTDSTLRIWDVNVKRAQKEVLVFKSRAAGSAGRTRMTAVRWASQAQGAPNLLVSAALDGSLVMWSGEGPYARPAGEIRDAHAPDTWTSGLDISRDGRTVVTKGGDDTIKLWDTRKFKTPLSTAAHPSSSSQFPTSNIVFAPDSAAILTGSPAGDLHILNPATLRPEVVTPVTPGSTLVTVRWHAALNQILTGSANAETHVLFDPARSARGAVAVLSKLPKRRHIDDDPARTVDVAEGVAGDSIVAGGRRAQPASGEGGAARHPTLGLTASGKSRDPRRPHLPVATPFAKSQPDAEHVRTNIPLSSMRDEDPREALLKYADKSEKEPLFTNAWRQTQPKTIYADLSDDEEEAGPDKKKAKVS